MTIREVLDPGDRAVAQAYDLLSRSFSREERIHLDDWLDTLQEKASRLTTDTVWHLLVAEHEQQVVGLTSGTYLGNLNIGVVGYLAIDASARGLGLGSRLRGRLRTRFQRDARRLREESLAAILGEVSEGNPWMRTLSRREKVLVLDFPYFQPTLYEGDDPSPFLLYYESMGRVRTRLPVSELRRILYAVWRRIYRVSRPLDRPAFRIMLRALEQRRSVGRHPASRALR